MANKTSIEMQVMERRIRFKESFVSKTTDRTGGQGLQSEGDDLAALIRIVDGIALPWAEPPAIKPNFRWHARR